MTKRPSRFCVEINCLPAKSLRRSRNTRNSVVLCPNWHRAIILCMRAAAARTRNPRGEDRHGERGRICCDERTRSGEFVDDRRLDGERSGDRFRQTVLAINHLEGHLLSPFFNGDFQIKPNISLVVSGGHTISIQVGGLGDYRLIGRTVDDAAGEAFDKVAKMLGPVIPAVPRLKNMHATATRTGSIFRAACSIRKILVSAD